MPAVRETTREVWEGADFEPLARVVGRDEAALQEADVTDIDLYIYEVNSTTEVYSITGVDPGTGQPGGTSVVFDSLQTDGRWKADSTGYNFRYAIRLGSELSAVTLEGGRTYRVEFFLNTTAWGVIPVIFKYAIKSNYQK